LSPVWSTESTALETTDSSAEPTTDYAALFAANLESFTSTFLCTNYATISTAICSAIYAALFATVYNTDNATVSESLKISDFTANTKAKCLSFSASYYTAIQTTHIMSIFTANCETIVKTITFTYSTTK
jgi:hypothetical protein